jgi:hypothetical protein
MPADRKNFVKRIGELSVATNTSTYAWALVINHIHLNSLRAKLVKSSTQLDSYRWSGHRISMGKIKNEWQDRKIEEYITKLCKNAKVSKTELRSDSRRKEASGVRSLIVFELVR